MLGVNCQRCSANGHTTQRVRPMRLVHLRPGIWYTDQTEWPSIRQIDHTRVTWEKPAEEEQEVNVYRSTMSKHSAVAGPRRRRLSAQVHYERTVR